jgi:hypothetical protein
MNEPDFARLNFTLLEQSQMFAVLMMADATLECVANDNLSRQNSAIVKDTLHRIKAFCRQMELDKGLAEE